METVEVVRLSNEDLRQAVAEWVVRRRSVQTCNYDIALRATRDPQCLDESGTFIAEVTIREEKP